MDDTAYYPLLKYIGQLGVQYIDLYLIHHPRLAVPDIPTAWKKMEGLKNHGLVKYISYFSS
jgi:diketogulonate reductase-like aldo/keto reductase